MKIRIPYTTKAEYDRMTAFLSNLFKAFGAVTGAHESQSWFQVAMNALLRKKVSTKDYSNPHLRLVFEETGKDKMYPGVVSITARTPEATLWLMLNSPAYAEMMPD